MTTKAASPTHETADAEVGRGVVEKMDRSLDQWHARIDELRVQIDLASLDVREDMRKRLEVTENVYLAVRSRLSDARHDANEDVAELRRSIDQLLHDLQLSYDAAEAVVRRSHEA